MHTAKNSKVTHKLTSLLLIEPSMFANMVSKVSSRQ